MTLRLPESLKEAVERAAAAEAISVNAWLVRIFSQVLSGAGPTPPPPPGPPPPVGADSAAGSPATRSPDHTRRRRADTEGTGSAQRWSTTMSKQTDTHEFTCAGPIDVRVRIAAGDLSVLAEATTTAAVHVAPADGSEASREAAEHTLVLLRRHAARRDPRALRLVAPRARARRPRVPTDSRLRADLGSADVRTDGQLASAVVHTGSGDATLRGTIGDLTVESGSGDVRVGVVDGALRIKSGSGDVLADTVSGPVTVKGGQRRHPDRRRQRCRGGVERLRRHRPRHGPLRGREDQLGVG